MPSSGWICIGSTFRQPYVGSGVRGALDVLELIHIHPEDGSCNIWQNVGQLSTLYGPVPVSRSFLFLNYDLENPRPRAVMPLMRVLVFHFISRVWVRWNRKHYGITRKTNKYFMIFELACSCRFMIICFGTYLQKQEV